MWSMCLSVCVVVTAVSPAKMAEPIKTPFKWRTRDGPGNRVSDGGTYRRHLANLIDPRRLCDSLQ